MQRTNNNGDMGTPCPNCFCIDWFDGKATNNEGEVSPYDSGHYDIDKSHGKA